MRTKARSAGRTQTARRCVSWIPLMSKSPRPVGISTTPRCGNPSLMPIFPARVKRSARACPRRLRSSIFLTMTYDFDRIVERRYTESNKWHKYPADVLPLWVADMDFSSPEPVVRALRERVEHGVFGYGVEQPEFYEVFLDRLQKRYGWRVPAEALLVLPGVIPCFNLAARAFTTSGDGVLL